MRGIDFRSDTVTLPTEEMRLAMSEAQVGDDVYGEDPTVNQLEKKAARLLGKEAALFVPSGTMGNQASIMAQTRPGDELIAASACHIVRYEAGGAARLSGVSCALAEGAEIFPDDLRALIRPGGDPHYPRSRLLCLENALGNGDVVPLERMRALYLIAKEYGLSVHLDGARLFNAALALDVPAADLAACADSISLCLSKGLGAPVGSLILGPADFIQEARRCRKVLGGGLRQAGVLAACGLIALDRMVSRLAVDHENARLLGDLMAAIPGLTVHTERLKINMVFWSTSLEKFDEQAYIEFMAARGIRVGGFRYGQSRLVTHKDVNRDDVEFYVETFKDFLKTI
ncbi:MAG: threonine aldolase [Candidatus Adiutrix sp.]|jgi:threonine aldolase|nr:threonine aldolase [Candidatus Adiutrix sp.]